MKPIGFLISLAMCSTAFAMQPQEVTFLMPIVIAPTHSLNINVLVAIPKQFRPLHPLGGLLGHEFIPRTDTDETNWSEIIATQAHPRAGFGADHLIEVLKTGITNTATDVTVWEQKIVRRENYISAVLKIIYTHLNRRELLWANYFSGPYDCSGIQYTINLRGISQDDAHTKINRFFTENVRVFNLDIESTALDSSYAK